MSYTYFCEATTAKYIMTSDTMIVLLLLLTTFQDGLAITGYEELEKHFLVKLGLNRRPMIDKNVKIPSATMELYKLMITENTLTSIPLPGLHTNSANTARTYINKGIPPVNSNSQRYRLQFDIDSLPKREQIKAAEVRFTLFNNAKIQDNKFIHVLIHDIVKPGIKGLSKPILRLMDSKSISVSNDLNLKPEVISFDVTPAIERLSENNFLENHGMIIQCITESGSQIHLLKVFDFESSEKPLLIIYTDDGTNKKNTLADIMDRHRNKRSNVEKVEHKKSKKKICQRYPLYVDFKEVGFSDWIHAPQGYDAYYCQGACTFPLANHMNASNHAVMQTLMNFISPNIVTRACCVPTKLISQTLLYVDDEGKLVVKNYPDMAVEECGCR